MSESDRGRYIIQTAAGLEATVILRNAAGGKSRFSRRGTSAVVSCVDPVTCQIFQASITELRILRLKEERMTEQTIADTFGGISIKSLNSSMERLTMRLYRLGWNMGTRESIAVAQRLGLLDGQLQEEVDRIIHSAPRMLPPAERAKRFRQRRELAIATTE